MSDARTDTLAAIRGALGRGALPETTQSELRAHIARPQPRLQPAIGEDTRARFVRRVQAAAMTLAHVAREDEVPQAVAAYVADHGLPTEIVVAPALAALPWPDTLRVSAGAAQRHTPVGVTPCAVAIAETGSVVLPSAPDTPTTLNFVPDDHIVVVHAAHVVMYLEDAWARLRERYTPGAQSTWPRTVNVISGPSRTADVDQVVQIGVHGPRRVHVILVG